MARMYINVEYGKSIDIIFFTTRKSALANAKRWVQKGTFQERYQIREIETWMLRDDCGLGFSKHDLDEFESYGTLINVERHQE